MLEPKQKQHLESQLKHTREVSERTRLCVILGYNDGVSVDELAKILRISQATVYAYLDAFKKYHKTKNDPTGGSKPKLTSEQSEALEKHLKETTYLKVKHICQYVEETYGVKMSRSGMTDWLKKCGFVFKKPKRIPGKLDPEKQKAFIKKYEELKANLKADEEIYFADGVHPEHQSQATCGWIKKGEIKTLQSTGKQLRLHFAGAICLKGMKVVAKEYETVDADAIIDLCKTLESRSKASKIYVIFDNARSNKNKKFEEYLRTSRIEPIYLPPYSPNLNPIERLWKIMKESKIYNRYYESSVTFFHEIRSFFFNEIPKKVGDWDTRINDKFQSVTLNPVKTAF